MPWRDLILITAKPSINTTACISAPPCTNLFFFSTALINLMKLLLFCMNPEQSNFWMSCSEVRFLTLLVFFVLQEKRKRQTEIDDKRSQLDDLVLQLQHLKVGVCYSIFKTRECCCYWWNYSPSIYNPSSFNVFPTYSVHVAVYTRLLFLSSC